MITRKNYHTLFIQVFILFEVLCLAFYLYGEYNSYTYSESYQSGEPLAFLTRTVCEMPLFSMLLLFCFPACATWVIAGIIRLTSKLEPKSEEQRTLSFTEQQTNLQLYTIVSMLLLVPLVLGRNHIYYDQINCHPKWVIFAAMGVHAGVSYLLVLFVRKLSKLVTAAAKIVAAILLLTAGVTYNYALYLTFLSGNRYEEEEEVYADEWSEEDSEFTSIDPDELVYQQVTDALKLFPDSPSFITSAAAFIPFDPNYFRNYAESAAYPDGTSAAEIERLMAQNRQRDSLCYRMSRFYNWLFVQLDSDEAETIVDKIKTALLHNGGSIDYNQYAMRVDMLDLAYRELETFDGEEEDGFSQVYAFATEHPLDWTLYCENFITDPYIRHIVGQDDRARKQFMWAYTFWGRRDSEGTRWMWRYALDQLLDVHPNTHYPFQELYRQRELLTQAQQRATDFLKWYKANYWSFQELKPAEYDNEGTLVAFTAEAAEKYGYALEKSGYLSPKLIERLRNDFADLQAHTQVKAGQSRHPGEWLRTDPLIPGYHTLASTLDAAECRTDSIRQVGSNMQLSHPAGLTIDVECINGEWFIYNVSARAPR